MVTGGTHPEPILKHHLDAIPEKEGSKIAENLIDDKTIELNKKIVKKERKEIAKAKNLNEDGDGNDSFSNLKKVFSKHDDESAESHLPENEVGTGSGQPEMRIKKIVKRKKIGGKDVGIGGEHLALGDHLVGVEQHPVGRDEGGPSQSQGDEAPEAETQNVDNGEDDNGDDDNGDDDNGDDDNGDDEHYGDYHRGKGNEVDADNEDVNEVNVDVVDGNDSNEEGSGSSPDVSQAVIDTLKQISNQFFPVKTGFQNKDQVEEGGVPEKNSQG